MRPHISVATGSLDNLAAVLRRHVGEHCDADPDGEHDFVISSTPFRREDELRDRRVIQVTISIRG